MLRDPLVQRRRQVEVEPGHQRALLVRPPDLALSNLIFAPGTLLPVHADLGQASPGYEWPDSSFIEVCIAPADDLIKLDDETVIDRVMADMARLYPLATREHLVKAKLVRIPRSVYRASARGRAAAAGSAHAGEESVPGRLLHATTVSPPASKGRFAARAPPSMGSEQPVRAPNPLRRRQPTRRNAARSLTSPIASAYAATSRGTTRRRFTWLVVLAGREAARGLGRLRVLPDRRRHRRPHRAGDERLAQIDRGSASCSRPTTATRPIRSSSPTPMRPRASRSRSSRRSRCCAARGWTSRCAATRPTRSCAITAISSPRPSACWCLRSSATTARRARYGIALGPRHADDQHPARRRRGRPHGPHLSAGRRHAPLRLYRRAAVRAASSTTRSWS